MEGSLGTLDIVILAAYCGVLVYLGLYYRRKCRTAQQFMVADRTIPAWAAGLAVMSAYTSSISYIATPGKAYDSNWHVFIFSLCIIPVAWLVCRYAVPYYRKMQLVSVYAFLEDRLGAWGRIYAALSFLLFMVGRMAVILYLVSLLISVFVSGDQVMASSKADPNSEMIEVLAGEEFVIPLDSDPTTGNSWDLAEPLPEWLELVASEFRPAETGPAAIGGGGAEEWTIKATGAGTATLKFEYRRPGEQDQPVVAEKTFAIVSRSASKMGIIIVVIGVITIIYTLLGGMEAVIWTDVMQSVVMIVGIIFCAVTLSTEILSGPEPLIRSAIEAEKFSLGSLKLSLSSRTVWVMILYGVTENLRNLMADQNYVQKYSAVPSERDAKRSVWIAMLIYIPLTAVFLYIGTALFAFYSGPGHELGASVTKGDEVFPYFIATELPMGLRGLILAAIVAAAMSTVDSALNCSATVLLLDFVKRYLKPEIGERGSLLFLRLATIVWGLLGTGFALLMIRARSALDVWWQISGIFGGGILGLFLLSLLRVQITLWQGLVSIAVSIAVISWGTFARDLPDGWRSVQCTLDPIIVGAVGTGALMAVAVVFGLMNRCRRRSPGARQC